MKQPNKDTFMVVNLSEMVPANEKARPYVEALENGAKLTSPLIKYGVNPATGVPLSDEFMASIVNSAAVIAGGKPPQSKTPQFASAVIGERRKMLIDIFFIRASMLFKNMVTAVNVQYDKEMRYRFSEVYKKLNDQYYAPWNDDERSRVIRVLDDDMFNRDSYGMIYDNSSMQRSDDIGRCRAKMSKLVDLDYYRRMPLGSVLECILPMVSENYRIFINNVNDVLVTPNGLGVMAIDYDDFIQFIGMCHANVIACAESIVKLLYDEANILIDAAYIGETGVDYDKLVNAQLLALRDAEHKLHVNGFTEVLNDDPSLLG